MSARTYSEDEFWELVNGEWIPTQKQQIALDKGAVKYDSGPIYSNDGFWEFIDNQWIPSHKQKQALQMGTVSQTTTQMFVPSNQQNLIQPISYYYANTSNNNFTPLLIVVGGFFLAFSLSIILVIASISPEISNNSESETIEYGNNDRQVFSWEYQSKQYSIGFDLEESTYNYYKSKDHTCCYEDEDYLDYSTPRAGYVIEIAESLETMAISEGHTSQLERAEFILAFVGSIPYVFDPDDDFDHPKYPIETLWENGGDCEDSSALYASIMEALGYETILVLLETKFEAADSWGGHALIGIHISNHTGESFTLNGDSKPYYIAETTIWEDGYDGIGINWWYDMQNIYTYAID